MAIMAFDKVQSGSVNILSLAKIIIIALLLIWMAASIASLFWRLLPEPPLRQGELAETARAFAPTGQPAVPTVDINALKEASLFGRDEAPPAEVVTVPETIPEEVEETTLNLELVGSFANNDQRRAYAIIASGRTQELYRVNQVVAGLAEVKLTRVLADRVILDNRGRREALYMYPDGQPLSSTAVVSPELAGSTRNNNRRVNPSGRALSSLSPGERLEKITDVVRFSRKTQDGVMQGFRVLPGRNRAAFEQTGLQLNDVVTAIDGQVLDNLQVANQIYQQKRNATRASLTVLRGEELLTLEIDLDAIRVD